MAEAINEVASSPTREVCRICGDASSETALIHPCRCSGSIGAVHADCLQHWISVRPRHPVADSSVDPRLQCELCHGAYRVRVKRKFHWALRSLCSWRSCAHIVEILILLFVLAMSVVLWPLLHNVTIAQDKKDSVKDDDAEQQEWDHRSADNVALPILLVITVALTLFTVQRVCVRCIHSNSSLVVHMTETEAEAGVDSGALSDDDDGEEDTNAIRHPSRMEMV